MSVFALPLMMQVPPDTTAPSLSSANGSATGETTAGGSVVTNEGNGTLYWVVSTSGTAPTATQVKTGKMHTGSSAAVSGSQAVSSTGTKAASASGLTASTTYYFHFMQEDMAGNQSTVRTSGSFTTDVHVTPGNQTFSSSGTFSVPAFHSLTVYVYGGGGGGGGGGINSNSLGDDGGDSSFGSPTAVIARGGKGGEGRNAGGDGGAGGTAQGGSTNTAGGAGENHGTGANNYGGAGGDGAGPDGGDGGDRTLSIGQGDDGSIVGGGGAGGWRSISDGGGGGGGGGGYAKKTFTTGQLTVGGNITIVVGSGGGGGTGFNPPTSNGGDGARGKVYVEWS